MVTEEQIGKCACSPWEKEGRPAGKHPELYSMARLMLEEERAASLHAMELGPLSPAKELAPLSRPK